MPVSNFLPWLPMLSMPSLLAYNHFRKDTTDATFGAAWWREVVDSLSLPYDAHGGSKLACALHLAVPYTVLFVLIATSNGKYAMNVQVKVQGVLKRCLKIHAFAAFGYSLAIELIPQLLSALCGLTQLPATDTVFVMKTAFADLFFVLGVVCLLMSMQDTVPRWATWIPIVQVFYNVMNDFRWSVPGSVSGGVAVNHRLRTLDGCLFVSFLVSYLYAHFNAVIVKDPRKNA
jgi:hypothetical protein